MLFSDLGLHTALDQAVEKIGYTSPTPIQEKCIPIMQEGVDLMGIAQTGTGKTAAFVLPILNRIYADMDKPDAKKRIAKSCRALILVPTRELAAQVADSVRAYSKVRKISHVVVMGGVKAGPQIRALAPGVDICIATPGRLLDHMSAGVMKMGGCRQVVLDEADQMLDMGFIPAIRKIMDKMPDTRQTVMFSATMPQQIKMLAKDFLDHPKQISVTPDSTPVERIDQRVAHVDKSQKRALMLELMQEHQPERGIIFVRTKRGADNLERFLSKAGLVVGALHGDKSQGQRVQVMKAFRDGKLNLLVATDIAARGIDVNDVTHVFNYELPNVPEAYVHRIGRTARAGKKGMAFAFCAPDERPLLRDIERTMRMKIPLLGGPDGGYQIDTSFDEPLPEKKKSGGRNSGKGQSRGARPQGKGKPQRSDDRRGSQNPKRKPHRKGGGLSEDSERKPETRRAKPKSNWKPEDSYAARSERQKEKQPEGKKSSNQSTPVKARKPRTHESRPVKKRGEGSKPFSGKPQSKAKGSRDGSQGLRKRKADA